MPKAWPQIPLSPLGGGINRFEQEAGPEQAAEALDVINDDGDLRRRDAFLSIATAAPHWLPTSRSIIYSGTTDEAGSTLQYSPPSLPNTGSSNFSVLWFCSLDAFDGIDWGAVTFSGSLTHHRRISGAYYNGSAWVAMTIRDETFHLPDGSSYGQSLARDGRITWHQASMGDWTSSVGPGNLLLATGYWIRLTIYNTTTGAQGTLGGTVSLTAPGVRCFTLQPVTMIAPLRTNGSRSLLLGSDRTTTRGIEPGARLGRWPLRDGPTDILQIAEDEGAGVYDVQTFPKWAKNGSAVGSSFPTRGTTKSITKDDTSYSWQTTQFFGSPIVEGLAVSAASTSASDGLPYSVTTISTTTITSCPAHKYERLILVMTSGTYSGVFHEIIKSTATGGVVKFVTEAFAALPSAADTFKIVRAAWAKTTTTGTKEFLVTSTGASTLGFSASPPAWTANITAQGLEGLPILWEVGRGFEWTIDAGRWSSAYDPNTQTLFLLNGRSGLLAWDGRRLRRAVADTTSIAAELLTGALPDFAKIVSTDPTFSVTPGSQLRSSPPAGSYIVDFFGTLVVAGFSGRPNDVIWSAPGGLNNVWPRVFTATLRDSSNEPITGLAVIGRQLAVFTRGGVFLGEQPDTSGLISFSPASQGIGSTSHASIAPVVLDSQRGPVNALLFASGDGVYLMAGQQPEAVIDRWSRILPGGVNEARLGFACATALPHRKWYVLAVASQGSDSNDRLIVYDYGAQRTWLWSHPFGVSSLATEITDAGREVLLVGTDDGHVQILTDAPTDDGEEIDAYAKSAPIRPFGDHHGSFLRVFVNAQALGAGQTMDLRFYSDRKDLPFQTSAVGIAAGLSTFGTSTFEAGTAPGRYADQRLKTAMCNLGAGARGTAFQYRVGGTARWRLRAAQLEARQLGARPR